MQDDVLLIEAYRNGDSKAFEALYEQYVQSVYRFVYGRIRHTQTAEDIVSQTFLQALDRLETFNASRGTFVAWIHRIARNLVIDHIRTSHPSDDIENVWDLSSDTNIPHDVDAALQLERIQELLKDLKPDQREVILLRTWHGFSFADIADILDSTEAACKMSYKRSVEKLRDTLLLLLLSLSILSP